MITSAKTYLFGGKISTLQPIDNPYGVEWWVSTAKGGLFSEQSTRFLCVARNGRTVDASLVYFDHVSSEQRLRYHDYLTVELDKLIETGEALSTCVDPILKRAKKANVGIGVRFGREIETAGYLEDKILVRNQDGTWSPRDNS